MKTIDEIQKAVCDLAIRVAESLKAKEAEMQKAKKRKAA